MLDTHDPQALQGCDVYDRQGDKIGSLDDIYQDDDTGAPEFGLIRTGIFGTGSHFVPLRDASTHQDGIQVPFDKDQVRNAPGVEADDHLDQSEERALYEYYGVGYSERRSDSGLPDGQDVVSAGTAGRDTSGPTTDDAMTRSEEELHVGKERRETGRVRLRKYVVTENVTKTVPVQREEVRVEREPITDGNVDRAMSGPDISEEEHEVVLTEEQPVVEKRTVPKERVRLEKDTVTDEETVTEDVRKERIDTDGGTDDLTR